MYGYMKKLRNKELTICPWCNKPFDQTGWANRPYVCDLNSGTHKPLQYVVNGRILKPL